MKATYQEAARAFRDTGLEFAVLKGFSHCPRFVSDPRHRPQGDLDLFFAEEQVEHGVRVALGFRIRAHRPGDPHPHESSAHIDSQDGLGVARRFLRSRRSPVSLELHFSTLGTADGALRARRVGGSSGSGARAGKWTACASRACIRPTRSRYAALHMLRHLLRGSLRPSHVYELAWMLHHSADASVFWNTWRELHDASLRRLEAICFALAQRWFDCRMPAAAREEIERLPAPSEALAGGVCAGRRSPARFHPNKDELWLHWSLLDSASASVDGAAAQAAARTTARLRGQHRTFRIAQLPGACVLRGYWRSLQYAAARLSHHVRAVPATIGSAVRWFGAGLELGADYWRFLLAEGFFDFGMFVFFFLYNLYLLRLGFQGEFPGADVQHHDRRAILSGRSWRYSRSSGSAFKEL